MALHLGLFLAGLAFGWVVLLTIQCFVRPKSNSMIVRDMDEASMAYNEISGILQALNEQCTEEWVTKSLEDFTLAATVTRAIRWHKDTVTELKDSADKDRLYIEMIEPVALRYVQTKAPYPYEDGCGERKREYIIRNLIDEAD